MTTRRSKLTRVVPRPERVRTLQRTSYGWIATDLLRRGWLGVLSPDDVTTYVLLCLAADREGISFYRRGRMARELGLGEDGLNAAIRRLVRFDLVAHRPFRPGAPDGFWQVLALPPGGPPSPFALLGIAEL
jgi:hypothetical protein